MNTTQTSLRLDTTRGDTCARCGGSGWLETMPPPGKLSARRRCPVCQPPDGRLRVAPPVKAEIKIPVAVQKSDGLDSRLVVSVIDDLAGAISRCWFDLSPEAKVRALELESRLSFLRRQLA